MGLFSSIGKLFGGGGGGSSSTSNNSTVVKPTTNVNIPLDELADATREMGTLNSETTLSVEAAKLKQDEAFKSANLILKAKEVKANMEQLNNRNKIIIVSVVAALMIYGYKKHKGGKRG